MTATREPDERAEATGDDEPASSRQAVSWPGVWAGGATIAALFTVAVAYPVLQLLGAEAAFFVVRGALWWEPVVLAVVLTVVAPLAILLVVWLSSLVSRRLAGGALLVVVGLLGAVFGVGIVNQLTQGQDVPRLVTVGLGILLGAALAWIYRVSAGLRAVLRFGWLVPVLALGVFLVLTPASRVVWPAGSPAASLTGVGTAAPPIVMIVFDELPIASLMNAEGEVDEQLFPSFARLAQDGVWYRDAVTAASFTTHSVPAILTGIQPPQGLPFVEDHPNNLLALLGRSYDVHARETLTQLCPPDVCGFDSLAMPPLGARLGTLASDVAVVAAHALAPEQARGGLPPLEGRWAGFAQGADATEEVDRTQEREGFREAFHAAVGEGRAAHHAEFLDLIGREVGTGGPHLFFLHSLLPHSPWEHLPSGVRYHETGTAGQSRDGWGDDEWLLAQGRQRHLLQTGFVDQFLGDIIATLEDAGVYEEALVIVTADHGVTFEPNHDPRALTAESTGDIEAVPLFIKYPGADPSGIEDAPVLTTDIVPTILDHLEVADVPTDGRSLLGDDLDQLTDRDRTVFQRGDVLPVEPGDPPWRLGLQRKVDVLGEEPGPDPLYRFGTHGDLVGRPWADLDVDDEPADLEIALHRADALDDLDPDEEVLPVHVVGDVTGPGAAPGVHVAVAVNGVVQAVGRTLLTGDGQVQLRVLVPQDALAAGANDVQLGAIVDEAGRVAPIDRVESP